MQAFELFPDARQVDFICADHDWFSLVETFWINSGAAAVDWLKQFDQFNSQLRLLGQKLLVVEHCKLEGIAQHLEVFKSHDQGVVEIGLLADQAGDFSLVESGGGHILGEDVADSWR